MILNFVSSNIIRLIIFVDKPAAGKRLF